MTNKIRFRVWGALLSVAAVSGAAVISANTGIRNREYRDAVSGMPASLRRQATLAPPAAAGAAGAVSDTPAGTSAASSVTASTDAALDDARIAFVVGKLLVRDHYLHLPLDKTISNRMFDRFLDSLDPQHEYFTQADVAEWAPLRDSLAPLIDKSGDTTFARTVFDRYRQRFDQRIAFLTAAEKTRDFTFTANDYYDFDRKDAPRPKDIDEAQEIWWQQLRSDFLQEELAAPAPNAKPGAGASKAPAKPKTKQVILDTLSHRYLRVARNIKEMSGDDIFAAYIDQLADAYDPHTDYFGKRTTAEFNMQMRLSLFGIGAQLITSDEGFVKIMMLTPGGPAIKSKKLSVGDQVTAVGQGATGDMVEIQDMNINKVVEMIRGPKGTTVRLSIMPTGATDPATRRQITLVRDEIKLEDQAAKAQIIDLPTNLPNTPAGKTQTMRLGVINLPSFYGGGDSPRKCSEDVRRLIDKLKTEKVAGIVLDLRTNPGGALDEAINVAGLFLPRGPVVMVAHSDGHRDVESSDNASVAYNGPLVVLTSRQSASASEIVAGALRDYGRAVVIGDGQTYGKGTVQSVIDLRNVLQGNDFATSSDPGSLHLTIQKFYLPSGASTQRKGVPSDLTVPSPTVVFTDIESSHSNALAFDTISPAKYERSNRVQPYLSELKRRSAMRVAANPLFADLRDDIARFEKLQKEKRISLNETQRRKDQQDAAARDAARKKQIAAINLVSPETVYPMTLADADKPGLPVALKTRLAAANTSKTATGSDLDADSLAAAADGDDNVTANDRDITLGEAERILADYVALSKK